MTPPRGEVHVWSVNLNVPPETSAALSATLTEDERERGARFRFERDRQRFVVAHGVLRALLGRYLGAHPRDIRFVYNAYGKPALSPAIGRRLEFNLSHSGARALIAVAADARVGVDLECIRALPDYVEVAQHFFTAGEADDLRRLPSHRQARAFFRCWTRKEAYVKACGEGLGSAEAAPDQGWSFYRLAPAPGYVGALVVAGSRWHLRRRSLDVLDAVNGPGWS